VVAEHNARVAPTPPIAPAEMATDHTRLARSVTAIARIHRVPLVTGTRVRAVMAHRLIARAVMVRLARLARLATVLIPRGLHVMATRVRPAAVAIVPTLLVLRAMAIPVRAAMAMTAHVLPAATAIQAAGLLGAMAIRQVDLPVRGETALIRQAPRATDPDQSVLVAIGLTVLVRTARIDRVPIVPMATSHGASGSPMGESVARSARR
jgi:hypothetical protein